MKKPWYFWTFVFSAIAIVAAMIIFLPVTYAAVTAVTAAGIGEIYSPDSSRDRINSVNNLNRDDFQKLSVDQLLEVIDGKAILNWLDKKRVGFLSEIQLLSPTDGGALYKQLDEVRIKFLTAAQKSTISDQEWIDSFNRMDAAGLQLQSLETLLNIVNGKPVFEWLDSAHINMLSGNQRKAIMLYSSSEELPVELREFLKKVLADDTFLKFTGPTLTVNENASFRWSGDIVIDGNNYISLYEKYRSQITESGSNNRNHFLGAAYENILDRANMSGSSVGLSNVTAQMQALITWLGTSHNTIRSYAPAVGQSHDIAAYAENVSNALKNEIGKFVVFENGLLSIKNNYQQLKENGLSDRLVQWALDGASQSPSNKGNLSYNGIMNLDMRQATTVALTTLFNDASYFVRSASQGLAQVVENKRVRDEQSLITKIFDIVTAFVTLGSGVGKAIMAAGDTTKLALESGAVFSSAMTSTKNQVNNWLRPNGDGINTDQYLGGFSKVAWKSIDSSVNELNRIIYDTGGHLDSMGLLATVGLSSAMQGFNTSYKNLLKELDDKLYKSKVLLFTTIENSEGDAYIKEYNWFLSDAGARAKENYYLVETERTYATTNFTGLGPSDIRHTARVDIWGYNPVV